jgi:hypothetical protein
MFALFDTVFNQLIPYGCEELRCIKVERRQQIKVILLDCDFSMV